MAGLATTSTARTSHPSHVNGMGWLAARYPGPTPPYPTLAHAPSSHYPPHLASSLLSLAPLIYHFHMARSLASVAPGIADGAAWLWNASGDIKMQCDESGMKRKKIAGIDADASLPPPALDPYHTYLGLASLNILSKDAVTPPFNETLDPLWNTSASTKKWLQDRLRRNVAL